MAYLRRLGFAAFVAYAASAIPMLRNRLPHKSLNTDWCTHLIDSTTRITMHGTTYVYDSFFRPYISKHETDIDRNLMEIRTRIGDMFVLNWQRAASYGQIRIYNILQYIASQSIPKPHPPQPPQTGRARPPAPNSHGPATEQEAKEPSSPDPASSSSDSAPHQRAAADTECHPLLPPTPSSSAAILSAQKAIFFRMFV
ncbi:hypothetical protein QVD17_06564 [Tagetes erecta]|uniref:Uncharacterized protein n=1 Tax=Tagetes erecta TaxID=13708 RepID=A0AAD8PBD6_TARER|nr:hypothetical protein QVD17_06564 [Tagetes erecta]